MTEFFKKKKKKKKKNGGPENSTLVYLLYLYRNAFNYFEMGYASAMAWILFLIVLVVDPAHLPHDPDVGPLRERAGGSLMGSIGDVETLSISRWTPLRPRVARLSR